MPSTSFLKARILTFDSPSRRTARAIQARPSPFAKTCVANPSPSLAVFRRDSQARFSVSASGVLRNLDALRGKRELHRGVARELLSLLLAAHPNLQDFAPQQRRWFARDYFLGIARYAPPYRCELDEQYQVFLRHQRQLTRAHPEKSEKLKFALDLLRYAASLRHRGRPEDARLYYAEGLATAFRCMPSPEALKILEIQETTAEIIRSLFATDPAAARAYWRRILTAIPFHPSPNLSLTLKGFFHLLFSEGLLLPKQAVHLLEDFLNFPNLRNHFNLFPNVHLTPETAPRLWELIHDAEHGAQERHNDDFLDIYRSLAIRSNVLGRELRIALIQAYSFALRRTEQTPSHHEALLTTLRKSTFDGRSAQTLPVSPRHWKDQNHGEKLANAIHESDTTAVARDSALVDLMESYASQFLRRKPLKALRDLSCLEFLLDAPEYPRSERKLLSLIRGALRTLPSDQATRAFNALDWYFQKIA